MRILMICPIPLEFTTCRSVFSLRDGPGILGCRSARGTVSGVDIAALESGPTKARAAAGTVAGISHFHPDLVLDTGTCGALDRELILYGIVFAHSCLEYDISGTGLPHHVIPEMKLPSSISFLPSKTADSLVRAAIGIGKQRASLSERSGQKYPFSAYGRSPIMETRIPSRTSRRTRGNARRSSTATSGDSWKRDGSRSSAPSG